MQLEVSKKENGDMTERILELNNQVKDLENIINNMKELQITLENTIHSLENREKELENMINEKKYENASLNREKNTLAKNVDD